jgi:hypothetical protein
MNSTTMADSHALRVALGSVPGLASHPAVTDHANAQPGGSLHLAVMTGPYLKLIVEGVKTVESRFHKVRSAPLNTVTAGDLVVFKPAGQPVSHVASVERATYLDLSHTSLDRVRSAWQERIADSSDSFWTARADARWLSLVEIAWVVDMPALTLRKRDRRGWVTYGACCPTDYLF